jgi:hypothetical protein
MTMDERPRNSYRSYTAKMVYDPNRAGDLQPAKWDTYCFVIRICLTRF